MIRFDSVEVGHVAPALERALATAEARLEALVSGATELTYAATLAELDDLMTEFERPWRITTHLLAVMNSPELRAAYNGVLPELVAFAAKLGSDPRLYQLLSRYAETEEAASLDPARARFLSETLADLRREGAALPERERDRVAKLKVELAQLSTKFSENVLDATNAYELVLTDESRLAGLPADVKARARAGAEARGVAGYRLTLQMPSYLPVMRYAEDRELRCEL